MAGLDVLGEDQHASARMVAADGDRSADALVGVAGRHPYVHDGGVRVVLVYGGLQVLGVAHGGYHHVSPVGQDLGEARRMTAESSAITMRIFGAPVRSRVGGQFDGDDRGAPGRAGDVQTAIDGPDPVGEPGQSAAGLDAGAAGAIVADPQP